MSESRGLILVLILAATAVLARPAQSRKSPDVPPIAQLPYAIGTWTGFDDGALDAATAAQLGADAYLTRTYSAQARAGCQLLRRLLGAQRPGASIHSPLHCLPGTGWEPVDVTTVPIRDG